MSRFYKTTKTPTVDYAYVYPFEELFRAMKYKQDRHDKALATLNAGYDEFLNLKYRPADADDVAKIRAQAEAFVNQASKMPLHNAQGYITRGINNIMNTPLIQDIASNYDLWAVQEQKKQQLMASGQWSGKSASPHGDVSTYNIGGIGDMTHTPAYNWRQDAETYFNNMAEEYRNTAGIAAEARKGSKDYWKQGYGYRSIMESYPNSQELFDKAYNGDKEAVKTLENYSYDILNKVGHEFLDLTQVEPNSSYSGGPKGEDYVTSLYNTQVGKIISSPTGAKLNLENIITLMGGTDSKYGNPNGTEVVPSSITNYHELKPNEYYVQDPQTKKWTKTTVTGDQAADVRLQSLQIAHLKTFKDSPYYTFYEDLISKEDARLKTLLDFKNKKHNGFDAIMDFINGKSHRQNINISRDVLQAIDPVKFADVKSINYWTKDDFERGGMLEDFVSLFNNATTNIYGGKSISEINGIINKNVKDVDGVDDYNAQLRKLKNVGIINPFDEKWTTLIEKVESDLDGDNEEGKKARKQFNTVIRNNDTSFDFVPNANAMVTTKMVEGDDGQPKMVMVIEGNYLASFNDLNNVFSESNGFEDVNPITLSDMTGGYVDADGEWTWGLDRNWWELYGHNTDRANVAQLVKLSDKTQKVADGKNTKEVQLFEIPATIEVPIDMSIAPDYNKKHGQYGTGDIQRLTPEWESEFITILLDNIANQEEKFEIAEADARVTSQKANFEGLLGEPDVTLYDEATSSYIDRRPGYVTQWFEDPDQGVLTHLKDAYPDGKGEIYKDMMEIITEIQDDLNGHIDGTVGTPEYQGSLHNLAVLHTMLNPANFEENIYLSNMDKQRKFRNFVNGMDEGSNYYGVDNNNSNEDIGIVNGKLVDDVALRRASRQYATKREMIEFDSRNYNNIDITSVYAPFVSKNAEKVISYVNGLDLGGKLTITGLMRIPGYDAIVGKSKHPGHGLHTQGRGVDFRVNEASTALYQKWQDPQGKKEMQNNGIINFIKETNPDHYHMEVAE